MKKELKTERISIRCTPSQKQKLEKEAEKYEMPLTTYCADKLFKGKMRVSYAKRKICRTLVNNGRYLDELSYIIENEQSDYISKELITQPLDNARREISTIWKY